MAKKRQNPAKAARVPVQMEVPQALRLSDKPDFIPTMTSAYAEVLPDKKGKKA
jgi:hypothetical protein